MTPELTPHSNPLPQTGWKPVEGEEGSYTPHTSFACDAFTTPDNAREFEISRGRWSFGSTVWKFVSDFFKGNSK